MGAFGAVDRGFTLLWLAYPAMLFSMPNAVRVGVFPPETLVAACYLFVLLMSVTVSSQPVRLRELGGQIPLSVLIFYFGVVLAIVSKGNVGLVLRVVSWGGVLLIAAVLFRDASLRLLLWKVWFTIGIGTAVYSLATHGVAWPEEVDILAWTHRTVLGYFLAMSLLLGTYLAARAGGGYRQMYLAGAAVCGAALAASMARGAWLFAVAGMLIQLRVRRSGFRVAPVLGVIVIAVLAAAAFGASGIAERARSIVDLSQASSTLYRANIYLATLRSLPHTWLLGAPSMEFGPYLAQFSVLRYPHLFNPQFATDSDIVHMTLLGGLPLLAMLASALAKLGLRLWHDMKASGDLDPRLWLLLLLGAQLVLDNVFSSALGWFYLGVLVTAVPLTTTQQTRPAPRSSDGAAIS